MKQMELDPERLARIADLVVECGPLCDAEGGMDDVQQLLAARRVGVMDSIIVTWELLGTTPGSLGEAKGIVLSHPSRSAERRQHQVLVEELLDAVERLEDDG